MWLELLILRRGGFISTADGTQNKLKPLGGYFYISKGNGSARMSSWLPETCAGLVFFRHEHRRLIPRGHWSLTLRGNPANVRAHIEVVRTVIVVTCSGLPMT